MSDKQNMIVNYHKWDQAFWVFLDVYTSQHPAKITELIQYSHIIQTAASTYAWENMYMYDREFRKHIERHPT